MSGTCSSPTLGSLIWLCYVRHDCILWMLRVDKTVSSIAPSSSVRRCCPVTVSGCFSDLYFYAAGDLLHLNRAQSGHNTWAISGLAFTHSPWIDFQSGREPYSAPTIHRPTILLDPPLIQHSIPAIPSKIPITSLQLLQPMPQPSQLVVLLLLHDSLVLGFQRCYHPPLTRQSAVMIESFIIYLLPSAVCCS